MKKIHIDKSLQLDLPLFFLFGTLLSFSGRTFSEAQSNLFSADNMIRMVCLPTALLIMIILMLKCDVKRFCIPKEFGWLLAFWAGGLFSFFHCSWLSYALVKWVEYFTILFGGLYIVMVDRRRPGFGEHAFFLMRGYLRFLIGSVLLGIVLSPSKAFYTGNDEFSAIKNAVLPFILGGWIIPISSTSVGMIASILLFMDVVELDCSHFSLRSILNILVLAVCVIFSQSRTAILGFAVVLSIYLIVFYRNSLGKFVIFCLGTLVLLFASSQIYKFLLRGQNLEMLGSLSGRTEWWGYAWRFFRDSGWYCKTFGNGFAAGEKVIAVQSNQAMYTLDSEYFAILISNGLYGLFFYVLFWISAFQKAFRRLRTNIQYRKQTIQILGIFVIILVRTVTVTTLAVHTYYLLIMVFSVAALHCTNKYNRK